MSCADQAGIELTLELDDRFVDLLGEGYDAIVRHGPVDDDRIIVKRLSDSKRVLVASSDYLKRFGNPASLQELGKHRGIGRFGGPGAESADGGSSEENYDYCGCQYLAKVRSFHDGGTFLLTLR